MDPMDTAETLAAPLAARVAQALRDIFGEWAAACDPAPRSHLGPRSKRVMYARTQ